MAINVSTNFNLGAELPLDVRYAVNTYADLSSLVKYEGLPTYVKDEDAVYRYNGTQWVREVTSVAASANGKIKVNGEDITVYTHPTGAGSKHVPSGGAEGNFLKYGGEGGAAEWSDIDASDLTYTNSSPMIKAVGGLEAGSTFDNMPLEDVLNALLYPYVAPGVTLRATANGGGVYEASRVGSTSPTFEIATTKNSLDITSVKLYTACDGGPLLDITSALSIEVSPEGGTQSVTVDPSLLFDTTVMYTNTSSTITVKVSDGKSTVTSNAITYDFVPPFYFGVVSEAPSTYEEVFALEKMVAKKGNKTVTFTTTESKNRYCFCCPVCYGELSKILDGNGFNNTSDFTVNATEWSTEGEEQVPFGWYIYTYNNAVAPGTMDFTFVY